MDTLDTISNKNLFLFCNEEIKNIHSKYPNFMRSCLYSHVDEEVLQRLYEICHILLTGETEKESDRRETIERAQKHYDKMLRNSAVRCSAVTR